MILCTMVCVLDERSPRLVSSLPFTFHNDGGSRSPSEDDLGSNVQSQDRSLLGPVSFFAVESGAKTGSPKIAPISYTATTVCANTTRTTQTRRSGNYI